MLYGLRPRARAQGGQRAERSGSYRDVFRHRVFMALMALNALFITAGIAQLEILPAYAKNEAGVSEHGIGWLFFINTLVVVVAAAADRTARSRAAGGCRFSR